MKNKYADLHVACQQFNKLAEETFIDKVENVEKAIEYVCRLAGQLPTPVGNPFSIVAFALELDKSNYLDAIIYLLTAIPAFGTIGLGLSKAPWIMKGSGIVCNSPLPLYFKKSIIEYLFSFYRNPSLSSVIGKSFEEALKAVLKTTSGPEKVKKYAKKLGVSITENTSELANNISNKVVETVNVKMNEYATELGKMLNTLS